jgi:predicted PurR-regulated permease PerM
MEATKQAEFIFNGELNVDSVQSNQTTPTLASQINQMQQTLATQAKALEQQMEATHQSQQHIHNTMTQIEQKVQHNLSGLSYELDHFNEAVLISMISIVLLTICTTVLMTSVWQRITSKRIQHTIEGAVATALKHNSKAIAIDATSAEVEQIMRTMQTSEKVQSTTVDS